MRGAEGGRDDEIEGGWKEGWKYNGGCGSFRAARKLQTTSMHPKFPIFATGSKTQAKQSPGPTPDPVAFLLADQDVR